MSLAECQARTRGLCASHLAALALCLALAVALVGRAAASPVAPRADSIDYVAQVRADFSAEDRLYARVRQGLALVTPLYDVALCLLLLATGVSARLRDLAHRVSRRRYVRSVIYLALLSFIVFALELPLQAFGDYGWEHRFGLSNQTAVAWLWDAVKAVGLGVLLYGATGLLPLALWTVERTGRRWWVWLGVAGLPVGLVSVLAGPLVVEPAFNRFTPLRDTELTRRILAEAARAGVPARRVVEVDRSRQTKKLNAYVSGFGPSQRIVIWDTTLEALPPDEILSIVGHEMGHYALAHLWKGVVVFWVLGFGLLALGARLMDAALRRFGPAWGVRSLHDEAALPLVGATLGLLLFAAQPVACAWSRRIEHEADTFELEVTRNNDAAARSLIEMGRRNRSDPEPPRFIKLMLYTHPPLIERVRFAARYRPWAEGRPNRYFRPARP